MISLIVAVTGNGILFENQKVKDTLYIWCKQAGDGMNDFATFYIGLTKSMVNSFMLECDMSCISNKVDATLLDIRHVQHSYDVFQSILKRVHAVTEDMNPDLALDILKIYTTSTCA